MRVNSKIKFYIVSILKTYEMGKSDREIGLFRVDLQAVPNLKRVFAVLGLS